MTPPLKTIYVSSKGRDILIKIKRRLGIERWNEICRVAVCRSLANPTKPTKAKGGWDTAIEIEWKTFAGEQAEVLSALFRLKARKDQVNDNSKDEIAEYFRAHLERGIQSLQNTSTMQDYLMVNS